MPCPLIVRTALPAAAILSLLGQPAWAGGPACWNTDELPAAQLHAFHTALMVGALKCRTERPDALSSYNAFVEVRKSSINAARTVVQARFIRDKGAEAGLVEFKNFDTEIANRASIDGPGGLPCDGVDTYSRLAASASPGDLYTLASLNTPSAELRSCGSEPTLAIADPVLKTVRADEVPEQAGTSPAIAPEQPGDVAQPEMQPALQTQAIGSATPPQKVATAETPAQGGKAAVDPAKALEDAARALAEAASSLRTASAANP